MSSLVLNNRKNAPCILSDSQNKELVLNGDDLLKLIDLVTWWNPIEYSIKIVEKIPN